MLEALLDNAGSAIRLTFPATGGDRGARNTMVLAGCAETLDLDPEQAVGLRLALAKELAAALSRHSGEEDAELTIELGFEPDGRRITLTTCERIATTTSCDGGGPEWTEQVALHPSEGIRSEFAGPQFVQPILPRAFAGAALDAGASFEGVTQSLILGGRLADAALETDAEVALVVGVHAEIDSLSITIQASSEWVLSGMAAEWPGAVEWRRDGGNEVLRLSARLPTV